MTLYLACINSHRGVSVFAFLIVGFRLLYILDSSVLLHSWVVAFHSSVGWPRGSGIKVRFRRRGRNGRQDAPPGVP